MIAGSGCRRAASIAQFTATTLPEGPDRTSLLLAPLLVKRQAFKSDLL